MRELRRGSFQIHIRSSSARKCVIIALSQLDDAAKLRALEERMWIWNEPLLNSLMNLYDKPYIVP